MIFCCLTLFVFVCFSCAWVLWILLCCLFFICAVFMGVLFVVFGLLRFGGFFFADGVSFVHFCVFFCVFLIGFCAFCVWFCFGLHGF